jgi:hypothetical protein
MGLIFHHSELGALTTLEIIKHFNRCLYPSLHEVDATMEKLQAKGYTEFDQKNYRKKLYRERNIPLGVL